MLPRACIAFILLFFLGMNATAQDQAANQFLGKRITGVELRGAEVEIRPERKASFLDRLPHAGDVLSRGVLRKSIEALYSTLEFSDVKVDAEPDGDGVRLIFITNTNLFVGNVRIVGAPQPPTASQLINASKFELGELFSPPDIETAITNMKRLLADNGYYEASIQPQLEQKPQDKTVNIIFTVTRGPHARVGEVNVVGDPGYTIAQVRDIAKMHAGDKVTTARVNRALTRLRKKYQKQDRLEAQVALAKREYHPETDRLDYTFRIERGDKVSITVEGAKIRKGLVKKYVPVYEENAVDDDLLNEGRRNLRDYFESKGYFNAEVDFRKDVNPEKDKKSVVFEVDKGDRYTLTQLEITGNHVFRDDEIKEHMIITPASLLLSHGRFSQSQLTRDVQSIESLYRGIGYRQVKVTPRIENDVNGHRGHLGVTINIEEGPQTVVADFKIQGAQSVSLDELRSFINTAEDQPYSDVTVTTDREAILNYYFNHGFPDVQVEASAQPLPKDPHQMKVRYTITEGHQEFVDRVIVSGLNHTKRFVVDRELEVHSGAPLSQSDMLNTQQRLYDLGVFNEVNVAVQNPKGIETRKNVVVQVAEARRYTFNYGFGLEVQTGDVASNCKNLPNPAACQPQGRTGVSPRVSFDVTRINFLGRNYTLLLKSRVGRLQQRALVSLEAPRVFNSINKTLTFTTFFDKTQDVRTFTAERLEGSAQVQHVLDKASQMLYRIVYRRVQVDPATLQVDPNLIPLLSRPVRVGFPSATYIRDTRDNPIESTRGLYSTANLDVATKVFASESNFTRVVLQNSSYHVIKRSNNNQRLWILARSTRLGIAEPYGSLDHAFVPLPERFFAGGSTSHRGFAINQAGPRDLQTGFPIGGNALFINNIELRTPPIVLPFVQDNLSLVFFHDAGNVFTSPSAMVHNVFQFTQPKQQACRTMQVCDYDYLSQAIGAGLRYRTPIGPVRVDVGYNLNPPFFARGNQGTTDRLDRINFSFSIGQTF